mgnify:CR=1 FL=1
MELTKQTLLQAIEDQGRIYMEFMGEYYGDRYVEIPVDQTALGGNRVMFTMPGSNGKVLAPFDFSSLKDYYLPWTWMWEHPLTGPKSPLCRRWTIC